MILAPFRASSSGRHHPYGMAEQHNDLGEGGQDRDDRRRRQKSNAAYASPYNLRKRVKEPEVEDQDHTVPGSPPRLPRQRRARHLVPSLDEKERTCRGVLDQRPWIPNMPSPTPKGDRRTRNQTESLPQCPDTPRRGTLCRHSGGRARRRLFCDD